MENTTEEKCEHAKLSLIDRVLSPIHAGFHKCTNPAGPCYQGIDMGYSRPFNSVYCGEMLSRRYDPN